MNRIYYLSTCSTCKRIIKEIQNCSKIDFEMQDIKTNPVSMDDIDRFYKQTHSYEALFNKRAQKFKKLKLEERPITDIAYKTLLLKEYTYLKRPVVEINGEFFIGNAKEVVRAILDKLNCNK